MRIPGVKRLGRSLRWLRSRCVRHGVVLAYHRIADVAWDPFRLSVAPERFAEHLEILARRAVPVPLDELVAKLREGELPRRAVAVTFDDGYADNLEAVLPLLARHGVPATEFVVTGYLGREFWWDELVRLVRAAPLARRLRLTIDGATHEWSLGAGGPAGEPGAGEAQGPKERLLGAVHRLLSPLRERARREAIDQLREWSGPAASDAPHHRGLTPEEVRALATSGLVTVGAHTVTHPELPALSPAEQAAEIRQSKEDLEELAGAPVSGFAYPHGRFSGDTVAAVRAAGFRYACASAEDVVWRGSQPFRLARFWVPDCGGDELAARLRWWLDG